MSQKWQREEWQEHKLEHLITQAHRFGMIVPMMQNVTFGP